MAHVLQDVPPPPLPPRLAQMIRDEIFRMSLRILNDDVMEDDNDNMLPPLQDMDEEEGKREDGKDISVRCSPEENCAQRFTADWLHSALSTFNPEVFREKRASESIWQMLSIPPFEIEFAGDLYYIERQMDRLAIHDDVTEREWVEFKRFVVTSNGT